MQHVFLLLFGLGVGIVSGLLGIGGGVLLVPGLMILFGLTQTQAQGTSLAVLIPPIGILAAWEYYRQGQVHLPVVALIAVGFCLGAFLGARWVMQFPVETLRVAFGCLLLYLGWNFLLVPAEPPVPPGEGKSLLPSGTLLSAFVAALNVGGLWLWRRRRHPPSNSTPAGPVL
jgi:uncharacterized membrane protein YfcA